MALKMKISPLQNEKISSRITSRKKDVVAYSKNPFWEPHEVKVGKKRVTISGGLLTNKDTGESMHHAGIHRVEFVDESKFVKIFTQNIKVFFDLSFGSQKVLQCLLSTLQKNPNADGIHLPWFTVEDYSKSHSLKISRTTFHRALREMIEKGFIAESEYLNFYWINPNLFFNGDRMVFISEYRKMSEEFQKQTLSPGEVKEKPETLDWIEEIEHEEKAEKKDN
jgi:hypothetical protein